MSIASNLNRLHDQIADACARVHRSPESVTLMAVSKVQPVEAILEAFASGHRVFGENRVQEWQGKREFLAHAFAATLQPPQPIQTHLIGPLQNNKTTRAAEIFDAIDTLDSLKTAERLNAAAQSLGKSLHVVVEVKLSPEETKHGLAPADLPALLSAVASLSSLQVCGLMTVPPFSDDPESARPYFQHLRRLRDENQHLCPSLTQLSMGMSNDFLVAIEEGSTTVRLGTAIFGKRVYL